jgi:phosphoribosyl-ATP pyrophosphohydrolase/phosphoribosyl-AMP cyclohydrolase/histidinol dehydrogenase
LQDFEVPVPGGVAGQKVEAIQVAGCYAPGGRYPLPSSVLMTAVTARVAGVQRVVVASPRPALITLAAAHVAGADHFLQIGGAQSIAAMVRGLEEEGLPACGVVVGPGNKYVTAAKQLLSGRVAIDMLAGPSECLVVADEQAEAAVVAADLIAQAEHDVEARPLLVALSERFVQAVESALQQQLATLPTASVAAESIRRHGTAMICADLKQAMQVLFARGRFLGTHSALCL